MNDEINLEEYMVPVDNWRNPIRENAPLIEITCEQCNEIFRIGAGSYRARTKAVGHPPKYCSRKCMGLATRIVTEERSLVCEHCGSNFTYRPGKSSRGDRCRATKFCRPECMQTFISNRQRSEDFPEYTKGLRRNSGGYVVRRKVGDANSSTLEHTLVMEKRLERKLFSHEEVHH